MKDPKSPDPRTARPWCWCRVKWNFRWLFFLHLFMVGGEVGGREGLTVFYSKKQGREMGACLAWVCDFCLNFFSLMKFFCPFYLGLMQKQWPFTFSWIGLDFSISIFFIHKKMQKRKRIELKISLSLLGFVSCFIFGQLAYGGVWLILCSWWWSWMLHQIPMQQWNLFHL